MNELNRLIYILRETWTLHASVSWKLVGLHIYYAVLIWLDSGGYTLIGSYDDSFFLSFKLKELEFDATIMVSL
jgi:hypothetical protein